jgi:antitoxin component YwqK of YwqJK toxin-antitoxin module
MKAERNYKNGKKEGSARGYHSNGKLQGDWVFKNGMPTAATIYYRSGEKWLEHRFKEGKLNGITKEYDKEGSLIAERYYKDDKLVERKIIIHWF